MNRAVLHYVQEWLPVSEQFVHAHVSRSRHPAAVVSRHALSHRRTFPHRPLLTLAPMLRVTPPRAQRRAITAVLDLVARRYGVGAVHLHFGYCLPDVAGVVRRRRLPLVVSLHGHDATAFARAWPGHYGALERADAVIVPSRFLAERAAELGARRERVRVIPSGVDTAFFAPAPPATGPPVVGFVGRFVEKKGLDVLLAAWPAVRAAVPEACLRLLGYGPLEAMVRRAGDGVEVVAPCGDAPAAQVRDALRQAAVVVAPSRTAADGDTESLLLVNLEAQATGRPVVTTRHGGIPEFVDDGRTGVLVPEGDAYALAGALVSLLLDAGARARMAEAGPRWAARFDVRTSVAALDGVYDEVMSVAGAMS